MPPRVEKTPSTCFATATGFKKTTLFVSKDRDERQRIPARPRGNPGATGRGSIVKHPPERISSGPAMPVNNPAGVGDTSAINC